MSVSKFSVTEFQWNPNSDVNVTATLILALILCKSTVYSVCSEHEHITAGLAIKWRKR